MEEKRIHNLSVLTTGVEQSAVIQMAGKAHFCLARGESAAAWLAAQGVTTVEQVGEKPSLNFNASQWRERLFARIPSGDTQFSVFYATSIQPALLDRLAGELAGISRTVEWLDGAALPHNLPTQAAGLLGGSLQSIDILALINTDYPVFSPALPVLIHCAGFASQVAHLSSMLAQVYPAEHPLFLCLEKPGSAVPWQETTLAGLQGLPERVDAVFIAPCAPDTSLENFMQLIARLRAPDGCPWDRKQTHASLRPYLLEETYEALEQLDKNNMEGLKEELGDLLLQIALHAQIAAEANTFNITQVLQQINRKIVSRHPHVFGSVSVKNDRDVVQNWEKLKELERSAKGKEQHSSLLDGIPQILPALAQAQSIQERAARVGFDWPDIEPVLAKVLEEMREVSEVQNERERAQELGDLLFAVVNLVRWYGVDAESALRCTNQKFRRRFAYIESAAQMAGRELQNMTLEEMDTYWEESKKLDEP
ncbi:MAG TPA: nucleoside triphosphate pyrophosphohydrolase [Anaerolineaceae bacterium]|nr:nucleoside triphosphate pyrophosphohydrolase [Anaerolineaceae bacterium]